VNILKPVAKSNFHMHTIFSDGKDNPEDCILVALDKGMESIGFSDHVPAPTLNHWSMKAEQVTNYLKEITRLKKKYAKQIEVYTGFEMDYWVTENKNIILEYIANADYTIGSVHYIYDKESAKYYSVDGSAEDVKTTFAVLGRGDNRICVEAYYLELIRVIRQYKPDIVGHLDIIKKRNQGDIYFSENEKWYKKLIDMVLDEIALSQRIVEVNTGSLLCKVLKDTYPSNWILEKCCQRKIPIVLNSDAHQAQDIDGFFGEAITILRQIGFTQRRILRAGKWVDIEL